MIECYCYNDLYDIFLPQKKVKNFESKKNKNKNIKNNNEKKDDVKLLNKKKCRNNNKRIASFSIKYIEKLNTKNYKIQNQIKTMGRIRVNMDCTICHKEIKYEDERISNLCGHNQHMKCYRDYFDGPVLIKEDSKPNKCPECERKNEERKIKKIDLLRKK